MSFTIDIDIGGTFTDCVLVGPGGIMRSKTPTTAYDLSVGFRRGIEDLARQVDLSSEELIGQSNVIRYSTTSGLNTLLQRTGPKLGLITTAGHEHVLIIGRSRQWADGLPVQERRQLHRAVKPEPLINLDMTVGLRERIDMNGNVIVPIDREDVRRKVQHLVDQGAQGFIVSLLWSFRNPAHEQLVREVIEEEYPDYYLGAMPIILSSDVQPKRHEYTRSNVAVLSGYLHRDMSEQLSLLTEQLRDYGYRKPLYLLNNIGGVAKVPRTRAIDTFGAGPVAGLMASAHLARIYDLPRVLVTDMGGTSFDYGMVIDGQCQSYVDWPVIDRWATENTMLEVSSIGAGGGSVAWANEALAGRLEVGPKSAGSNPGPACYDLGGVEPTVADADVVLGFLNPDNFLGGKMPLNREKAVQALEQLGQPMGASPEEAAAMVKEIIDAKMGNIIVKEISLRGHAAGDFVLFAYGGAGPTHCAGYNGLLKAPKIMTFPHASVFCALGGAIMDFRQRYEASRQVTMFDPAKSNPYLDDLDDFNQAVSALQSIAIQDVRGEGFEPEQAVFELEMDMSYARQHNVMRVRSPVVTLESPEDVQAVCEAYTRAYVNRYSSAALEPGSPIIIHNFYLFVTAPLEKPRLPTYPRDGEDPGAAHLGEREVYWPDAKGRLATAIYDADKLAPGNLVRGPAIVEASDTTVIIPREMTYTLDEYLTGILEQR